MIGGHIARKIVQAVRRWRISVTAGVDVPATCVIGSNVRLRRNYNRNSRGVIALAGRCELLDGAIVETWGGEVRLDENVFVGPYTVIYGHGGVEIGAQTLISMHCRILSSNHTIPAPGTPIRSQPDILLPTKIGRDVWLGAGVTVLGGVTIGDGCVVGAGAVVTKDLPPCSIAIGVPARVVGARTTPGTP